MLLPGFHRSLLALSLALTFHDASAAERPTPAVTADAEVSGAEVSDAEVTDTEVIASEQALAGPFAAEPGLRVLETVVVSGMQPGPGLWKVSKDGRVLWVLGTVSPLPRRMEWNSLGVERKVAGSGVVLLPPTVAIKAKGAALGGIFLVPSLMRARNNPGKEKLEDVLPAADHERWLRLKAHYLGRDGGVEKRRPILAAMELRDKALEKNDLSTRDVVNRAVRRAADRSDVPIDQPSIALEVEDAKSLIKEFSASSVDDLVCFRRTLDQVENDLGTLATRANAWAIGEVEMLLALPYTDNAAACREVLLQSSVAQRTGMTDLPARVQAAWMKSAEAALAEHPESFAVLPIARVVGPSGYLVALEKRGYLVEAPELAEAKAQADSEAGTETGALIETEAEAVIEAETETGVEAAGRSGR